MKSKIVSNFHTFLQVAKFNVKSLSENDCVQHYPTSTVTDLLTNFEKSSTECSQIRKDNSPPLSPPTRDPNGELVDTESLFYKTMYEIEVWIKYSSQKVCLQNIS